jgi:hypothetical protein
MNTKEHTVRKIDFDEVILPDGSIVPLRSVKAPARYTDGS